MYTTKSKPINLPLPWQAWQQEGYISSPPVSVCFYFSAFNSDPELIKPYQAKVGTDFVSV